MPRQQPGKQPDGPLLQSLGKQGVVRKTQRLLRDVPGSIPVEIVLVNQQRISSATLREGCVSFIWAAHFAAKSSIFLPRPR